MVSARVTSSIEEIDRILQAARSRTVLALTPFARLEPKAGHIFSCFELWDNQDYSLGYNRYSIVKIDGAETLDVDYGGALARKGSFLPEVHRFFQERFGNPTKETEFTAEEGAEFTKLYEQSVVKWFSPCWMLAGGRRAKIPTYFCFEKEYLLRDLNTGEILDENKAARLLGHEVRWPTI